MSVVKFAVGTVEQFKGQERAVIILSTVQTRQTKLGSLTDQKRINGMLTGAIALMIVIGDTELLERNSDWRHLIAYCRKNKALVIHKLTQKNAVLPTVKKLNSKKKQFIEAIRSDM